LEREARPLGLRREGCKLTTKLDIIRSYFPDVWANEAEGYKASYARLPHELRETADLAFRVSFDGAFEFYLSINAWAHAFMAVVYWGIVFAASIWGLMSVYSSGLLSENGIIGFILIALFGLLMWIVQIILSAIGVILVALTVRKLLSLISSRLCYLKFIRGL